MFTSCVCKQVDAVTVCDMIGIQNNNDMKFFWNAFWFDLCFSLTDVTNVMKLLR